MSSSLLQTIGRTSIRDPPVEGCHKSFSLNALNPTGLLKHIIVPTEAGSDDIKHFSDIMRLSDLRRERLISPSAIRLVKILPRHDYPYVRCEMVSADLAHQPQYEVRKNLWGFLDVRTKQLEPGNALGSLAFIDQLCIDQSNDRERSHLVQEMGKIYSAARPVICWLGEGTKRSRAIMHWIRQGMAIDEIELKSRNQLIKQIQKEVNFDDLVRNKYFTRIWILQELILAKNLHFQWGSDAVDYPVFSRVTSMLLKSSPQTNAILSLYWMRTLFNENTPLRWDRVPDILPGRDCEDRRDRVYALLGLTRPGKLQPDYTKTLEEVFLDTARQVALEAIGETDFKATVEKWRKTLVVSRNVGPPFDAWARRYDYYFANSYQIGGHRTLHVPTNSIAKT